MPTGRRPPGPGALSILIVTARSPGGAFCPLLHGLPSDLPYSLVERDMPALVKRGALRESSNGIYRITDEGRALAAAFVHCVACSQPVPADAPFSPHKCSHKVVCEPVAARGKRSRRTTCARCNLMTARMLRTRYGERSTPL
jgi:hypothetical protein